jgi:7,8-dihydropterin-6-yl-methyl-4-(beta-D-ribofuranosyl)aminobenzene 5'-phosphate synthase
MDNMNIITLMDNRIDHEIKNKHLESQHGLSMHIETKEHHILFDTGQNAKFINNAKILGVDLTKVDICVISHGHYDHGGGLKAFLKLNNHAKVYMHPEAFRLHKVQKGILFKN